MRHIMLVDDNPQPLDLLRQLFEGRGYAVILAADGDEAIERFDPRLVAIVSDWNMARVNGDQLFRRLEHELGATRFIILTADPYAFRRINADIVPRLTAVLEKPLSSIFDVLRAVEGMS